MADTGETTNGRAGAAAPSVAAEVEWHLAEVARAVSGAPAPIGGELLRTVLTGFAEIVRQLVQRREEAPAAAPFLFADHVVSEAAHMWESRIREATRGAPAD
jgi:hypothetical protein